MKAHRLLRFLFVLPVLACSGDLRLTGVDLAALSATAEPWLETVVLDFRDPAARTALVSGWTAPQAEAPDFVWGSSDGSQLVFRRADNQGFALRLHGWLRTPVPGGELVAIAINGIEVGRLRIGATPEPVDVAVPDGVAQPGRNRLELSYPEARERSRDRQLVAWKSLQFGDRMPPFGAAGLDAEAKRFELPAGTGLDFFVSLARGAQLELAGIVNRRGARLEADLACDGEAPRSSLLEEVGNGDVALGLQVSRASATPCRLTLRATGTTSRTREALVSIGRARLLQPQRPQTPPAPFVAAKRPPNFLIYIVDTLRADRLGCYGYRRPLTPAIDAFARQGVLFERARAQSSWTRPTVATILTGMTPLRLGVNGRFSRLPKEVETLPERLSAQGYKTAYVTANGNTAPAFGFDQGVDFFRYIHKGRYAGELNNWRRVHAAGREFLDSIGADASFLLVLHTVEPHAPYQPTDRHRQLWAEGADPNLGVRKVLDGLPRRRPDPEGEIVRQVRDLYDAEVAGTDEGFGELLAELEQRGRLDDTVILFTADHGEELFEHGGVEHGRTLFEEQLRIPMIWRSPGGRNGGRRIASPADQLDVTPTVLELAGLAVPRELPGRSVATTLGGGPPPAETTSPAWLQRLRWHQESLVDGDFKLIRDLSMPPSTPWVEELLYDLRRDAGEREPLAESRVERSGLLRSQLRFWSLRSGPALFGGDAEVDEKLREELAALGYLN